MKKICELVERVLEFLVYRILHLSVSRNRLQKWNQLIEFGIVGVSNNIIYYIVYAILIAVSVPYLIAGSAGFFVSVINAYYWNNKYVFRTEEAEGRIWWKAFAKTFIAYAGTGLILNNLLLILWVDLLGIPEMIGPIINLFVTIPINFVINKFWTFRKGKNNSVRK